MFENKFEVTVENHDDYVFVRVAGRGDDIGLFVQSVLPAIELCNATDHKLLLLEDAIENDWNASMMEKLVSDLFYSGISRLKI